MSNSSDALANGLLGVRASQYTLLAGSVAWFYDILQTLDSECTLLWSRGGKLVKFAYLVVRCLLHFKPKTLIYALLESPSAYALLGHYTPKSVASSSLTAWRHSWLILCP